MDKVDIADLHKFIIKYIYFFICEYPSNQRYPCSINFYIP